MKNLFLSLILALIVLASPAQAETYDQAQGKSYQQAWEEGPPLTKAQLRAWVSLAATSVFDFSYENYEEQKHANKKFFTTLGYPSFYSALETSRMQEIITEHKQTVSGYILAIPRIHPPILKNERYQWQVDMVFAVAYETEKSITTQKLRVFMTVSEKDNISELDLDDELSLFEGVGIRKWVAKPVKDDDFVCEILEANAKEAQEQETIDDLQDENQSLKDRLQGLLDYIQSGSKE